MATQCLGRTLEWVLEYDTPKFVSIKSKTVGFINRMIQLLILTYVIAWVLVINKGYQEFSIINSAVTTKVKGFVQTNYTAEELGVPYPEVYNRIWDTSEYVLPPQENGAFFVLTNVIITPNQSLSTCAEEPLDGTICNETTEAEVCVPGRYVISGNGIFTGRCVNFSETVQTCEVNAWCPIEKPLADFKDKPLLEGTESFTVLIKNSVEFPLWKQKTRNILKSSNESYLSGCEYNEHTDPSCPIFRLGDIVDKAGENYTDLATSGGVVAIIIKWECNLDFNVDKCIPTYDFHRLDDRDAKIAKGWNFRFSRHFDYEKSRYLYKAYGILFVVLVQGRGGRFSTIPFLMNVGSGLALLSLAIIGADIVLLYIMRDRSYYKHKKYLKVDPENEDFRQLEEESTDDPE